MTQYVEDVDDLDYHHDVHINSEVQCRRVGKSIACKFCNFIYTTFSS